MTEAGWSSLSTLARALAGIARTEDWETTSAAIRVYNHAAAEVDASHAAGERCYQKRCDECERAGRTGPPNRECGNAGTNDD